MSDDEADVEETEVKRKSLWEISKPFGRPPKFNTPKELWDEACKYFAWIDDNPLMEQKVFSFQGTTHKTKVEKMHAMTINGLCLHMGITEDTLKNYSKKDDFLGVVEHVRKCIYEQKLTGAAADLLNASIISRELGLIDKTEDVGAKPTPIEITIPVADASQKD